MSQRRLNLFGDLVDTSDMPEMISNLFFPGRFVGNDFRVLGADLLEVQPGSALLPDGVLILEDEGKKLIVPNSSSPADYSIIYQLEDTRVIGGSPAILRLVSGTQRQENFTDAVILGWVRYPGGSVPLSDDHFIQPTPLQIQPQVKTISYAETTPFSAAIRPISEVPSLSKQNVVRVPLSHSLLSVAQPIAFGGARTRLISASIIVNRAITSDTTSYMTYAVKHGPTTLLSLSTQATNPLVPNVLPSRTPVLLPKHPAALVGDFLVEANDSILVTGQRTNMPGILNQLVGLIDQVTDTSFVFTKTGGATYTFSDQDLLKFMFFRDGSNSTPVNRIGQISGFLSASQVAVSSLGGAFSASSNNYVELQDQADIALALETPGASGKWQETATTVSGEQCTQWMNISGGPALYSLSVPFIISAKGQPRKLISRLKVDFNCIVTHRIHVGSSVVSLTPGSGMVSNTGSLITMEFDVPVSTAVEWNAGSTAFIELEINAQSGRGAAISFVALTEEPTPFLLFT